MSWCADFEFWVTYEADTAGSRGQERRRWQRRGGGDGEFTATVLPSWLSHCLRLVFSAVFRLVHPDSQGGGGGGGQERRRWQHRGGGGKAHCWKPSNVSARKRPIVPNTAGSEAPSSDWSTPKSEIVSLSLNPPSTTLPSSRWIQYCEDGGAVGRVNAQCVRAMKCAGKRAAVLSR